MPDNRLDTALEMIIEEILNSRQESTYPDIEFIETDNLNKLKSIFESWKN